MGDDGRAGRRLSWVEYTGWHSGLAIYSMGCEMLLASQREGYVMGANMMCDSGSDNAIYKGKYVCGQVLRYVICYFAGDYVRPRTCLY